MFSFSRLFTTTIIQPNVKPKTAPRNEVNPETAAQICMQGDIFFKKKEYNEAIILYKKASKLDPENSAPYHKIGIANHNLGNYNKAVFYIQKALDIDPRIIMYNQHIAKAYYTLEDNINFTKYHNYAKMLQKEQLKNQPPKKFALQDLKKELRPTSPQSPDGKEVEEIINRTQKLIISPPLERSSR